MSDNLTLDTGFDFRKLAAWVGAAALLVTSGTVIAVFCKSCLWDVVEPPHTASLLAAIAQAQEASDSRPPRTGAALQKDVDAITLMLIQNQTLILEQQTQSKAAALLAGAGVCQQAGGSPHQATNTCVFVVSGVADLVPLSDADALLGRIKLSSKAKAALDAR